MTKQTNIAGKYDESAKEGQVPEQGASTSKEKEEKEVEDGLKITNMSHSSLVKLQPWNNNFKNMNMYMYMYVTYVIMRVLP